MKTTQYFLVLLSVITLISCGGGGGGGSAPADPQISANDASISEGDSSTTDLMFTVSLNQAISEEITVNYATSDDTAIAGEDYTAVNGTVTIPAGSTSTTVMVSIIGDTVAENDETFTLTLSDAVGVTLGTSVATGTITDDDTAAMVPSVSVSSTSVSEGDSGTTDLTFTVSLNQTVSEDVTVDYATSDDTATAGADYTANNGTATILAETASVTVTVSVLGDTDNESDESLTLTLSNAVGATLGTASATGTIVNDDVSTAGGPYMLYGDGTNMYAVDVTDPAQTQLVGPQFLPGHVPLTLITGDLDAGNTALLNIRPDSFIYYYTNKFWRVDLNEGSSLTPVQISSADIGYLCGMQMFGNSVTPADSYIFYIAAANENSCISNSQAYRIQASDDSSVAPMSISGAPAIRIETMETGETPGEVTGFLVRNAVDFTVTRYDADFSSPMTLLDGSTNAVPLGSDIDFVSDVSFYLVDGVLYSYTHDGAGSAVAMHTVTTGSRFDHIKNEDFLCSATNCYFVEVDDAGVQSLFMSAINGNGSEQVGSAFTISGLTLTSGRLYITTKSTGSGQSLFAVNLPNGAPSMVDSVTGSDYFSRLVAMDDLLYYSSVNFSADSISAMVRKDDNSVLVGPIVDAAWPGFVSSAISLNSIPVPSEFILAEEVTVPAVGVKYTVYDAATATAGTVLGTVENSFVGSRFGRSVWGGTYLFGFGTRILGGALLGVPADFQLDVFFADKTTENSLSLVTNSTESHEGPL